MDVTRERTVEKPADAAPAAGDAAAEAPQRTKASGPKPARKPKRKFGLALYPAWCKKCGICGEFCATGALVNDEVGAPVIVDEDKCGGCMQCMYRCPDFCVEVFEKPAAEEAAPAPEKPAAGKKEDAA